MRPLGYLLLCCLLISSVANCAEPGNEARPSFQEIAAYVEREFVNRTYYQAGDIISESEVKPLFAAFDRMGWKATDRLLILALVPDDTDFIVRQLRSTPGRKFMTKISGYPLAYDRIDRMTQLPRGRQLVHELVTGVGGYEMLEYMTTTQGGKNLGKQLSRDPHGADFNKPTGRIYTVEALIARLKKSYDASATVAP
jgi:hypothetical protein